MIDVLVVGAGSSGCAVAARASENPNLQVTLVEAGPDYIDPTDLPFDLVNSHNNSYRKHDWQFQYEPTRDRAQPFPRGRVVGGSSAVNTTIALRGIPEDYDEWSDLGNNEWSWEKVLPAFNRLERDLDFGESPYHGDAGPITIRRYPDSELEPQHLAFLDAARSLGYPDCPDQNDPYGWGSGPQPMNKLGRLRISCAIGYLAPARARPNLDIRANSFTRRLLFDGDRCTGIEIETASGVEKIEAKTTIVCAGAIMTPHLLMHSGIGPKAQLKTLNIPLLRDLPVGQNLSDHPAISVVLKAKSGINIDFDAPIIQTILRYTAENSNKRNDLQIEQLSFVGQNDNTPRFGIAGVLEYQYGRGELTLTSADPHVAPKIDNRFCEDERDLRRMVSCFKDTLAFAQKGAVAEMSEEIQFPNLSRGSSDEDLASLCRKFAGSGYHPCGTAKMGDDETAVVDQYGRVHQLENIVVADASIMPFVPRANTNLTAIMIGEKIGEWLRTDPGRYGL